MKSVVFLCILPIVILIKLRAGITFGSDILFTEATHVQKTSYCVSQMVPFHGLNFIFCFLYYTDTQLTKASKQNQRKETIYMERNTSGNDHLSCVSISNSGSPGVITASTRYPREHAHCELGMDI